MVRRRISDISCNKEYFNKAAPAHKNAFKFSGFNENIQFTSTPSPRRNRNRKTNSSIHHIVSMSKPTSVEICMTHLQALPDTINTTNYSIETILRLATVACQIWQVSSQTITPVY